MRSIKQIAWFPTLPKTSKLQTSSSHEKISLPLLLLQLLIIFTGLEEVTQRNDTISQLMEGKSQTCRRTHTHTHTHTHTECSRGLCARVKGAGLPCSPPRCRADRVAVRKRLIPARLWERQLPPYFSKNVKLFWICAPTEGLDMQEWKQLVSRVFPRQ